MTQDLFIGLMSGTSADGIDAVLVSYEDRRGRLLQTHHTEMPGALREEILSLRHAGANELHRMAVLDQQLAVAYAETVNGLLAQADVSAKDISAIGSHGQTIRHHPEGTSPYTWQIGDPNRLAEMTGISVVADFRRRDMAAGGQGAPLVPAFHQAQIAQPGIATAIVNIGGIANITLISADGEVKGWDTGPGNTLMDGWIHRHQSLPFDAAGAWAATGQVLEPLLQAGLRHPFFVAPAPKSTGPEMFHLDWFDTLLSGHEKPEDVQRTLLELTAESIGRALDGVAVTDIRICGGGAYNNLLMERLSTRLTPVSVTSTEVAGVDPQWVEAWAFAWLAKQTVAGLPGNVPAVTGAEAPRVLGAIYPA